MKDDSLQISRPISEKRMAVVGEIANRETIAVVEAQKGDAFAFERLYREHVGRVFALCLRMTANAVIAEEMTQEAFVRAWEKLNAFRGDSAFGTWLCRIAINQVLSRQRRERRRMVWSIDDAMKKPSQGGSDAVKHSDPALKMDLEDAIAALPEGARTVFILHDIEGYRHEEIAKMAGIAAGTSKAHLHRARGLLKERLER